LQVFVLEKAFYNDNFIMIRTVFGNFFLPSGILFLVALYAQIGTID